MTRSWKRCSRSGETGLGIVFDTGSAYEACLPLGDARFGHGADFGFFMNASLLEVGVDVAYRLVDRVRVRDIARFSF